MIKSASKIPELLRIIKILPLNIRLIQLIIMKNNNHSNISILSNLNNSSFSIISSNNINHYFKLQNKQIIIANNQINYIKLDLTNHLFIKIMMCLDLYLNINNLINYLQ